MALAITNAAKTIASFALAILLSSTLRGQVANRTDKAHGAETGLYVNSFGFTEISPKTQAARMGAGMNLIGGDDPYWNEQPTAFADDDLKTVADAGFRTVRVPLFAIRKVVNSDGNLDLKYLAKIDHLIDLALLNHLEIILDEHDYDYCATKAAQCAVMLPKIWRTLARHYRDAPNSVLFELFNEPYGQVDAKVWNQWIPRLLAVVRATNPTRNVIIGPSTWNDADKLPTLKLPKADHHIIATFHYYLPFEFTHQGAVWAGPEIAKLRDVRWTGTPDQLASLNKDFDMVAAWAKENGCPMFLGEFGTYGKFNNHMDDRVAWTKAVSKAAADRGFPRAIWHYQDISGFGIHDRDKGWIVPLKSAVLNP